MAGRAVDGFTFEAEMIYWRGPAPFFFVSVPADLATEIGRVARRVSYGWGMIAVGAEISRVRFTTALFPKDGTYFLPVKTKVREKANITAGDVVAVEMTVQGASSSD